MTDFHDRLESMRALQKGWNGYGADPPSELALANAKSFLDVAANMGCLPGRVAPSAEGGVGIAWTNGRRRCYVEFFNNGDACRLLSDCVGEPSSRRIECTSQSFRNEIRFAVRWTGIGGRDA